MKPESVAGDLTNEDLVDMLNAAMEDEREGRLTRCSNEAELRAFFAELRYHDEE